jgi:hypothetical protein
MDEAGLGLVLNRSGGQTRLIQSDYPVLPPRLVEKATKYFAFSTHPTYRPGEPGFAPR